MLDVAAKKLLCDDSRDDPVNSSEDAFELIVVEKSAINPFDGIPSEVDDVVEFLIFVGPRRHPADRSKTALWI